MAKFSEKQGPALNEAGDHTKVWSPGAGFILLDSDEIVHSGAPLSAHEIAVHEASLADFDALIADAAVAEDMEILVAGTGSREQRLKASKALLKGLVEIN